MDWLYLLLVLGAGVAAWRIYGAIQRARAARGDDWDEMLVRNLRAQGGNAFTPYDIDFFFSVDEAAGCEPLAAALRAEDFEVDYQPMKTEGARGFSLHARKGIRVSVPAMQEYSARFRKLAAAHGASYDGWATPGVTRPREVPDILRRQR